MLKIVIGKLIKKHGLKGLLLKIGDVAVRITKTKGSPTDEMSRVRKGGC